VRKNLFLFLVLQGAVLFSLETVLADTSTVAVIPFRMNAEEPIGFIGDGVRDMLTSRIGSAPSIRVVKQDLVREALAKWAGSELTEESAIDVGRTLQADYVVFGSISKIGNNVSVDVSLLDVKEGGTLTSVFTQSLGLDEVVPHMNELALGITKAVTSRAKTSPVELPLAEAAIEGSSPGGTPGAQPLENIGVLFKETPAADEVSDDGKNEFQFEEAGQLFETDEAAPPEITGAEEREPETAEADEAEQENLAERLLKRKSPIDSTDENPAYQKSIDDLQDSSESGSEDTPQ
jgi:TolB-like protein